MRNEDVKNFLTHHRSRVNPEVYGFSLQQRRVKGLRREEVAQLAAVSVSWYTWLEQGRDISISPAALQRIGKVLQLTLTEQSYLDALIFGAKSQPEPAAIPHEVKVMVDALSPHPAFIRRANMDILYWNEAASSQIFDWSQIAEQDRNSLKLMFISDEYRQRIHQWELAAKHTLAAFRTYYVASNHAEDFEQVIEDLTARSEIFRSMWHRQDVSKFGAGNKAIIDNKGKITHYTYSALEVESAPGIFLIFYLSRAGQ
ncbi:helix-turn-helix transcriptional regulator [Kalamiella sp. sgz302252]|uniref:helix-turn-helix transcriptional regulator n=1 Tax=Pantoea sp. sgz302252 TaxID=3341827 RepID=UPI0036D26E5A